jgi:hypothetical protein
MLNDHKFRFGTNGKPLAGFFKQRKVKQERLFPYTLKGERVNGYIKRPQRKNLLIMVQSVPTAEYVEKYYQYNRKAELIAFVGC